MSSIKICPKCKEIMYFDYGELTDPKTYLVKCNKCGLTEEVKVETISETDLGNHIHFECQNCKQKDQRIAELEKRIAQDKKHIDKTDERLTELRKENAELKKKLESAANEYNALQEVLNEFDLEGYPDEVREKFKKVEEKLENAIVPKFMIGDEIWAVVSYITESEDDIYNNVIETGIVQKIEIDKRELKYWCDNGRIYWEDEFVKLFATKEEAQQKLKELEGE